jgi:hypothetical protein
MNCKGPGRGGILQSAWTGRRKTPDDRRSSLDSNQEPLEHEHTVSVSRTANINADLKYFTASSVVSSAVKKLIN